MKILKKSIIPLMLVMTLLFSNINVKAASHYCARGGTFYANDIVSNDPLIYGKMPMVVTYIPNDMVRSIHNTALSTSSTKSYLATYGFESLTVAVAERISKQIGFSIVPLVGTGLFLANILDAVKNDKFNAGINKAYNAGTGLIITEYHVNGGDIFYEYSNWNSNYIEDKLSIVGINGYVTGNIVTSDYDLLKRY